MAAGDMAFMEAARERMNDLMERASIVVFATHSLDVLPRFCERTILLSHGRIVADGPTEEVIGLYADAIHEVPGASAELASSSPSLRQTSADSGEHAVQ